MAEEPKKSGRGGRRPGAGRKPKGWKPPTVMAAVDLAALLNEPAPEEIDGVAQRHAISSIEALARLLLHGRSEAAKIQAAEEILDRGYGKPAVELGGDAALFLPLMMPPGSQPSGTVVSTDQVRSEARKFARLAVEALRKIRDDGVSEAARASAAKALLRRGLGTVAAARMPDEQRERPLGKKEEAARAAEAAATGRYATPAPPRVLERGERLQ